MQSLKIPGVLRVLGCLSDVFDLIEEGVTRRGTDDFSKGVPKQSDLLA